MIKVILYFKGNKYDTDWVGWKYIKPIGAGRSYKNIAYWMINQDDHKIFSVRMGGNKRCIGWGHMKQIEFNLTHRGWKYITQQEAENYLNNRLS